MNVVSRAYSIVHIADFAIEYFAVLGKTEEHTILDVNRNRKSSKRLLSAAEKEIMALYDDGMFPVTKKVKNDYLTSENENEETHSKEAMDLDEAAIFGDTDSENDEPVFKTASELHDRNDDTSETDENEVISVVLNLQLF